MKMFINALDKHSQTIPDTTTEQDGIYNFIMDTIGTSKLVLLIEVSFVEGSFNVIKYQNETRKVSLVVRCSL